MYEAALALSVATFVAAFVYFIRHPAFSIFHPLSIYMAFHGLLFVFRPVLASIMNFNAIYRYFQFDPSPEDKLTALLAANLGFVVFFIVCLWAGNAEMQFKQDRFTFAERERLRRVFPRAMAVCVPIGGYSMYHFWSGVGSGQAFAEMTLDRATGVFISTGGSGYLLEAQTMLASIAALIAWVYRFRLISFAPLLAFFLLRSGTGGRGPFIAAMGMTALMYFYEKRQKVPLTRLSLVVAIGLAAFLFVGENRGARIRHALGFEQPAGEYIPPALNEKFMEGMDFGNLEYFEYIVYVVPQRSGTYDYFLDNLQLFTEPIPRTLWKAKPIGPPIQRVNLMKYGKPNGMTRSLAGEGWYAWGWLGVMIWCGLWAYVLGRIYRAYAQGPQNTLQTAAYMVFLPILIVAYRDGSIVTIFRGGLFYFFPLMVWFAFARRLDVPTARAMRYAAWRKWRRLNAGKPDPELNAGSGTARAGLLPHAPVRRY